MTNRNSVGLPVAVAGTAGDAALIALDLLAAAKPRDPFAEGARKANAILRGTAHLAWARATGRLIRGR